MYVQWSRGLLSARPSHGMSQLELDAVKPDSIIALLRRLARRHELQILLEMSLAKGNGRTAPHPKLVLVVGIEDRSVEDLGQVSPSLCPAILLP